MPFTTSMLVVLPVCAKYHDAALRNLAWVRELEGSVKVSLDCVVSFDTSYDAREVIASARQTFASVTPHRYPDAYPRRPWPVPQNWAWREAALRVHLREQRPWFWWEQDAVPLKPGAFVALASEYARAGKPFMGTQSGTQYGPHLNGVAVYPAHVASVFPFMLQAKKTPFDVAGGKHVLAQVHLTPLIQHVWSWEGVGQSVPPPSFGDASALDKIDPQAVIFHRCKDGTLIQSLRARKSNPTPAAASLSMDPITVVITNYQRPDKLKAAFDSCVSAGVKNVVIASSGATPAVKAVHAHARSVDNINLTITSTDDDKGCNECWLRGVEAAKTEWVHILHDDDLLLPAFRALPAHLNRYPSAEFFHWDAVRHGTITPARYSIFLKLSTGIYPANIFSVVLGNRTNRSISPVTGLFKKDHLVKVLCEAGENFTTPAFYITPTMMVGNDLLIWLRAVQSYTKFAYIHEPLVSFGDWEGSTTVKDVAAGGSKLVEIYNNVRDYVTPPKPVSRDSRPDLSTVTLLAIDIMHPQETMETMLETLAKARFHFAVMLTDLTRFTPPLKAKELIHFVQHEEGENRPMTHGACFDHEVSCIKKPAEHLNGASHILFIEWDSGIRCPESWNPEWLSYDFIGAPWPPRKELGWPPCTMENCVGNTGFSLRSARFCYLAVEAADSRPWDASMCVHDSWLCLTMRPWLVERGIKFAPPDVAAEFSNENRVHTRQFGYHGKSTFYLNKWGTPKAPVWRNRSN